MPTVSKRSLLNLAVNSAYERVEVTVKLILSGIEVQPSTSVVNADCLVWYRQWAESH